MVPPVASFPTGAEWVLFKTGKKLEGEEWFYRKRANLNVVKSKIAINLQNLARLV
jgi:hypothetical protein